MNRNSIFGLLIVLLTVAPLKAADYTLVPFSGLHGWTGDNHGEALQVFAHSCDHIRATDQIPADDWLHVCTLAKTNYQSARLFFETNFAPVRITQDNTSLVTGYYEPELAGARHQTDIFKFPLYAVPPELPRGVMWKSRAEIDSGILEGRGLELVWLNDPVDALFVHIQGSARFNLTDGTTMRLGFAGRNGHPYRSVGKQMVELGLLAEGQASVSKIRDWVHDHDEAGQMALLLNPSFIFFQELQIDSALGPIGALQIPLTSLRSIAVDPRFTPLGAPAWVAMPAGNSSIHRLMIAQDTGSAITGAQRADVFFGSGARAGIVAGQIRYSGQLTTLVPRATALRLTGRLN